jgi:uncharacterized protein (TIGR02145 family)
MGTIQLVSVPYAMAAGSLREGALLFGNNGQKYQLTIDSMGPKWVTVPFSCGQSVTYAGESYPTVQIGTQCWMAKNLNVGTMINGSADQVNNSNLEKYCYNNDPVNCSIYGGLYQWAEAIQYPNGASNTASPNPSITGTIKGICPIGWHIPNYGEWNQLVINQGGGAGGKLKSIINLWTSPNSGATNISGFSALPSGLRGTLGTFGNLSTYTYFWTSTEFHNTAAHLFYLDFSSSNVTQDFMGKAHGFSVRCLQD